LRVGGISVAQEQLAVALALGAERVFCLAPGMTADALALQHAAERGGARFQVIAGPRGLLGQLTSTDELFALADGLFASVDTAQELLGQGTAVLVQPVEVGLDAGFERIDALLASGGALRIPGRLIERLADLPADCDAFSALMRIALQAGISQRALPSTAMVAGGTSGRGFWSLVRSEAEAHALEPLWIRSRTAQTLPFNPSRWLAQVVVRSFGPALLHAGSGTRLVGAGAGTLLLLALFAGWFGFPGLGLIGAGFGWICAEAAALLARIESRTGPGQETRWSWHTAYGWASDAVLVGLLAWAEPLQPWQPQHDRFFPPLMLLALLRLVPRAVPAGWTAWLEDRALVVLLAGCAMIAGMIGPAVHWAAVLLAIAGILWPRASTRLTPP
jgi:hypothetical protein